MDGTAEIMQRRVRKDNLRYAYNDADKNLTLGQHAAILAVWVTLLSSFWWNVRVSESIVMLGSYNLSVQDPMFIATTLACILALLSPDKSGRLISFIVWIFLILTLQVFLRGVSVGLMPALLWLRSDGAIAPYLVLATLVPYSEYFARQLSKPIIVVSFMIVALIAIRRVVGIDFLMESGGLDLYEGRPISSHGAIILVVSQSILLSNYLKNLKKTKYIFGALTMFVFTLLSSQGTASLCAIAVMGAVFGLSRGRYENFRKIIFIITICFAIFIIWIGPEKIVALADPTWANRRLNNVGFRQSIWASVMSDFFGRNVYEQIFGVPAGAARTLYVWRTMELYEYSVNFRMKWNSGFHSMYVGIISGFGFSGIITYISLLITSLFYAIVGNKGDKNSYFDKGVAVSLLLSAIILGYSYDLRGESLLLLMLPIIFLKKQKIKSGVYV